MKTISRYFVLLAGALLIINSGTFAQVAALQNVENNITKRVANGPLVGIAVGYISPDGEITYITAGQLSNDAAKEVDKYSVFKIGSITKVFTTLVVAELVEKQVLSLDTNAEDLLGPEFSLPSYDGQEITLRHLVTHTSGLPRLPGNLQMKDPQNPYGAYSKSKLTEFLVDYHLQRAPGSSFEYSNLGMAIVGHILEKQLNRSFEKIISQKITQPYDMNRSGIELTTVDSSEMTMGHYRGEPVPYWEFPGVEAMGALKSSGMDMMTFLRLHIKGNSKFIPAASKVHQPLFNIDKGNNMIDKVGMGWFLSTKQDSIWWHNGGTGGYSSFIGLNKETGTKVFYIISQKIKVSFLLSVPGNRICHLLQRGNYILS